MTRRLFQQLGSMLRARRGASFFLSVVSLFMTLAMLAAYCLSGRTTFTPVLSAKVLTMLGLWAGVSAVFTLFEVKMGKYAVYLLGLWTWLEFLLSQASYISNVLVGIDGNQFSVGFLLAVIFGLMSWLTALISAICQRTEVSMTEEDRIIVVGKEE